MSIKIIEKYEDYFDWNKLIQHCDIISELTDLEKEQAKRSFQFLRSELGENFLSDEPKHPIMEYIVNAAPWTRKWIIWFSEALKELKEKDNYSSLLNRIKEKDKFEEAKSVLEIAYKCSRAGFKISIDPQLAKRSPIPDLKLINPATGEELFIEITIMGNSKKEKDSVLTLNNIIEHLWRSPVRFTGRIHKILAEKHLTEIGEKVQTTLEMTIKESKFHTLIISGVIELGMAPKDDMKHLEQWANEKNLKVGEFFGPAYDVDEVARIDSRFETEQKQLPRTNPNIIVVKNNRLFSQNRDVRSLINNLEEIVYKYPHLLMGVIIGRYLGSPEQGKEISKDQHIFIQQAIASVEVQNFIILLNKYCGFEVSQSTKSKLFESFRIN